MSVAMKYGQRSDSAPQRMPDQPGGSGMELVSSGQITYGSTVTLSFEPAHVYVLYSNQYTISTGAYRGFRATQIVSPEAQLHGARAVGHTDYIAMGTASAQTYPNNSTVTIKPYASTDGLRYALYKIM